ncbi:hypothetical protein Nepgr_005499 [Nepenthes gracilis]|uniref:F-box/kelch-repeat protein n=1 Tax=Nepenthes gracilis TaxID=150966 RepID=A0AAD3XGH6_NEPGR|nr:hypothetical protein Nepgr_005499 [Nepenthes gracilis]
MELIPSLVDDVGRECLIRIPYEGFPVAAKVCRSWNVEIQQLEFWQRRKESGLTRPVVVFAQARFDPSQSLGSEKSQASTPTYELTLFEPEAGVWRRLPAIHGLSGGLPMFCGVVGVGLDLVVIGGWDPVTWQVSNSVYVFNFLTATWRRGADMPAGARSFFGCAADTVRQTVLVAGGHDGEKNALKSAVLYDVAKDEWTVLPDMARERDECKVIFHRGRLHVIGGYSTHAQGQFDQSIEAFDYGSWQWDQANEGSPEAGPNPSAYVAGDDGELYRCLSQEAAVLQGDRWQAVAEVPGDVGSSPHVVAWQGKLMAVGSSDVGGPYKSYIMDLKSHKWIELDVPVSYRGHIQSGCTLEL